MLKLSASAAPEPEEDQHGAGHAAVEGGDGEGQELGAQQAHAHQLGRDVHVANHHPGAADPAVDEVRRGPGQHQHEGEDGVVAGHRRGGRAGEGDAEGGAGRHLDGRAGVVVVEPGDADEAPLEEELRRQRRHREVEALDAQRRQAEHDADRGREQARGQDQQQDVGARQQGGELVAGVGTRPHEGAGAEREEAGVAGQQVEADGGERPDQERDHDRVGQEVAAEERDGDQRQEEEDGEPDPVLAQREDRRVGGVAGAVLAGLAVEHQTRSMIRSPNRPCGRTRRKASAMT